MLGVIQNYNFGEMEVMKYFAPPASWPDKKKQENIRNKIFSGDWLAAEKKDGFFAKFVKDEDGEMLLYSRSRGVNKKFANKINWVPQLASFFNSLPKGTCLLGELYLPKQPGSKCVQTILGCLEQKAIDRQSKGEKINFYIFDCLAWNGESLKDTTFQKRILKIQTEVLPLTKYEEYVHCGEFYYGSALWEKLHEILSTGGEGVVIMHKDGIYEPGKRPSKTTLKVKKEINQTIDCFFTGRATAPTMNYTGKEIETWKYWINQISDERVEGEFFKEYSEGAPLIPVTKPYFYKWAGSLEIGVLKDGATVPIGFLSGVTDEIKANPKDFAFKPIEVTCMEITQNASGEYGLRHAKMLGFREDLTIEDCTWKKIFG